MTVSELIEYLKTKPQNYTIILNGGDCIGITEMTKSDIKVLKKHKVVEIIC